MADNATMKRFTLSRENAARILQLPDVTAPLGLRDRAILELLYASGIRSAELCALDVADVNPLLRTAHVRHGKGDKARIVWFGHPAARAIGAYVTDARPLLTPPEQPALFVGLRGRRLLPRNLQRICHKYGGPQVTPHTWRHTCATALHEGGANLLTIKALLGHADLQTTALYTHPSIQFLQATYNAAHPLAQPPEPHQYNLPMEVPA